MRFQGIGGGVMRVQVVAGFLQHVYPRQPGDGKRQRIGSRFHFVVHLHRLKIGKCFHERLECRHQIIASAQLESLHRPLPEVQNQVAKMIAQLRLVLLDVRERAIESLLFARE